MRTMEARELEIEDPIGRIYAKMWAPETAASEVPIILLHDSLGSVDQWRDFPGILAGTTSRKVIAYDRLGFGKSGARREPPSIEFIQEESTTYFPVVKKRLSITKYILFGHSVGGAMSISIAARDTDCLAVVTMASQAFVEDRTVRGIEEARTMFDQPGQVERLQRWHGGKAGWVLKAWTDIWLSPEFSTWSLDDCIRDVACPVLVIHGDNDEYGSIAFPEFIAGRVSGTSEMLVLKDCGHMPHVEKTGEVVTAVRKFLDANSL